MAILDNEDKADIDEALDIYRKYKLTKVSIKKAEAETEQDLAIRWRRLEQELEVARLKSLEGSSIDVLIMAAKDPEQRKLFYSLARLQRFGAMTPEKIIATLLEEKPELKDLAKELILGMHDSGKLEQYEKLIKELKETHSEQKEVYDHHIQTLMQMFTQALGAARDIATGGSH